MSGKVQDDWSSMQSSADCGSQSVAVLSSGMPRWLLWTAGHTLHRLYSRHIPWPLSAQVSSWDLPGLQSDFFTCLNGLTLFVWSWVRVLAVHYCVVASVKLLTPVCLSPSGIIWYRPSRVMSLAGRVIVGLVQSNDSLPLGL